MTQQQVSGSSKTLLAAIRDKDVESPALMRWNTWQQWRRDAGLRPTAAADGEATTSAQESALWKSTMLELYGTEWALMLASLEELDEAAATALAPARTRQLSEPSLQEPAASAEPLQPNLQPGVPSPEPAAGAGRTRGVTGPGGVTYVDEDSPGSGRIQSP